MSTIQNLWGELPLAETVRTPLSILREQASQLTEITNGLLEGEVTTLKSEHPSRKGTPFLVRLSIIVPALNNYRYVVIRAYHAILLYPVSVIDAVNSQEYECLNENDFVDSVAKILSSEIVHKAIMALLSQSRAEDAA